MALEADVVLVDDVEAAKVGQAGGPAEAVGEGGRVGVAVAGLVEGEDDVAAPRELDREAVLGLSGVDIAVDREDCGSRSLGRRRLGHVEQRAHDAAARTVEAEIADGDPSAVGLDDPGREAADEGQD